MTNEQRAAEIQAGVNKAENLERLYFDNMGLWLSALRPFMGLCDIEDLKQQAFLSVAEAARSFDRERGAFGSFACRLIVQDIPVYLASCGSGLSCPAWYGKRKKLYKQLLEEGVLDEQKQAERLGVSVEEVRLLALVCSAVGSLNNPTEAGEIVEVVASGEDLEAEAVERIGGEELRRDVWGEVDKALSGRRLEIIRALFIRGESVASLAVRFKVSPQRIKQIENGALDRLRKSERLEELARDYEYITVFWWKCGLKAWKHTGTSCVEKAVLESEKLDRKRRRLLLQILQEEEEKKEQERKRWEDWQRVLKYVDSVKNRGA